MELDRGSTCRPRKTALPIARRSKKLRLCSMVFAARQRLPRVIILSKVWGRRRVSACAPLHHCHWHWHSGRICTVVFVTRIGEWDSFRPNALTCSRRQKCRADKRRCVASHSVALWIIFRTSLLDVVIGIIVVKPIVMVSAMRLPDYIAISFLFALMLWCVAGLARHKFKL